MSAIASAADRPLDRHRHPGWALALVVVAGLALWLGWVGFIASDDSLYYFGADRWLTHPPAPGDTHWSTRFPLILTFAAVLKVVGRNYAAFAVTALLCHVALVAMAGWFVRRVATPRAGWIAAMLTASLVVIVQHATTVSVDLLESAALLGGALLLGEAGDDAAGLRRGVGAGVCFGMAVLCRETSLLALAAFAPLFLLGRPVPRRVLLAMGLGFAAVIAGEALFQWSLTGDPLRRYTIAFHHDEHIDRAANLEGNFLVHPAIDPLLVLLVNDDFGLLFWLAGAALVFVRIRRLAFRDRRMAVLGTMALASFLLVAVSYEKLVLNPRYFLLPALWAIAVVAVWLDELRAKARVAVLGATVGLNLLLMSVGNAHPRWEMEAIDAAAIAHPREWISGDPHEVRRSVLPLSFVHLANTRYAPAAPGGLLVVRADRAPPGAVLARYPSPPTRLGGILQAVGLAGVVPGAVRARMFAPNPECVLVRTR